MLIAVEGLDAVGKTTWIRKLTQHLTGDVRVVHFGPPNPDHHILEEYLPAIESYEPSLDRHLIFDRLHWGEAVYGPLVRGGSRLSSAMFRYLDDAFTARGGLMIYVSPPADHAAWLTELDEGNHPITSETAGRAQTRYETITRQTSATRFLCEREYLAERTDGIVDVASLLARDAARVRPRHRTFVGQPHRPDVLLLGDRHASARHGRLNFHSAFVPYADTSGHFLYSYLYPGARAALANACQEPDLLDLWLALEEPRVVALGKHAANCATAAKVPFAEAPHPQYVRRFHHARGPEYVRDVGGGRGWSPAREVV